MVARSLRTPRNQPFGSSGTDPGSRCRRAVLVVGSLVLGCDSATAGEFRQEDRLREGPHAALDGLRVESLVVIDGGRLAAATSGGLFIERATSWERIADGSFSRVRAAPDGGLLAASGRELRRVDVAGGTSLTVLRHELGTIADFARADDGSYVVVGPVDEQHSVSWMRDARFQPRQNVRVYRKLGSVEDLTAERGAPLFAWSVAADASGTVFIGAKQGLFTWTADGATQRVEIERDRLAAPWVLGEEMRGLAVLGGPPAPRVCWGTDTGFSCWHPEQGAHPGRAEGFRPDTHGVPFIYVQAFARAPDGALWIGSSDGAARWTTTGRWDYFAGQAWLPNDEVRSIAVPDESRVAIGTARGLAIIARRPMTLARKSAHFDHLAAARHVNRHGFCWRIHCARAGEIDTASDAGYTDNDGLWTASWIAAQSLRFAVTGDAAARENAQRSMAGLMALETVTGKPGYPARSLALVSELSSRPELERWHRAPDGVHLYKGDTSSDEIVGHYFAHALYFDHVATGDEKAAQRRLVGALTDHIIDHGLHLVERDDGEPTRWGVWSPERCWEWGHYWYSSALWSLCVLSHLKVAAHITGDERYEREYRRLIDEHDYARRTLEQKVTFGDINHSDDQMALFSYYPLLRYEQDPELRHVFLASLERSVEIERAEASPTWNFVASAAFGREFDIERSLEHLERMPWMLFGWRYDNTRRHDLRLAPQWRGQGRVESERALPMTEIGPYGFTSNPFLLTSGDGGFSHESPAIFSLPYWLGRHHGFIAAER